MTPLRPFFSYYGSSWRKAKLYPQPVHDTIVEPFAGSLGYSCHYHARRVIACDLDEYVIGVWRYLQRATAEEILALPDVPEGERITGRGLCRAAEWFIGFWLQSSKESPRTTGSTRMHTPEYRDLNSTSYWGPAVRARIAAQLPAIRHWEIHHCSYQALPFDGPATWLIDPPYQDKGRHYRHGSKGIDYPVLAEWCRSRPGQVIVMEQEGAEWLPFEPLASVKSQVKGRRSVEVVWTKGPTAIQQGMFA